MSNITNFVFDAEDGAAMAVRSVLIDGEPWFVAADVCRALGLGNTAMALERLDDDEKGVSSIDTPSKNQHGDYGTVQQEMTIVNESGLYSLILGSRKPEAKRFKRWVTGDVLPSIRKTGAYVSPGAQPGIGQQQTQFLSHAADIMVAADRTFRSALRAGRSTGMPWPQAIRQANRVAVQKTGVDMLSELQAHEHLHHMERQAQQRGPADRGGWGANARNFPHALEFWSALQSGALGGMDCARPMLSRQLYQLYVAWAHAQGALPLNLPRLIDALCTAGVGLVLRKRYQAEHAVVGPAAFLYPGHYMSPPHGMSEADWLGACVQAAAHAIAAAQACTA